MRIHGLLFVLAAACTSSPSTPEQSQLESALETWSVHGPSHYSFTWQRHCECTSLTTSPMRVTVENGQIVSAIYIETEEPVGAAERAHLLTIDGVFDLIHDAIDEGADAITVQYSSQTGHPTSVAIDYDLGVADEEMSLLVSDFAANSQASRESVGCGLAPHE